MKKFSFHYLIIAILITLVGSSCNPKGNSTANSGITDPLDSTLLVTFFQRYPVLKNYEKDVIAVYKNHDYNYIWFDEKGLVEYANSLYTKVQNLDKEGIANSFLYQKNIDGIFAGQPDSKLSTSDVELLLTSLYLFYVDNVYKGIDDKTTTAIEWLLPRKKISYSGLLDSFISGQKSGNNDSSILVNQYYKLRDVLKNYRNIEQNGGWKPIDMNPQVKSYKPNDSAQVILQIRERLFVTGDISENNGSTRYDPELQAAVIKFKISNGYKGDPKILPVHIQAMNIPVSERIKAIVVNMERCRWISPEVFGAKEYIFANIPAYDMKFIRGGKIVFESPVVVGDSSTKTVIFGGNMSYIVFSPYWNLPKSIIEKEVMPGIEKNKNYLEKHDMEWNNGQVRQKPGPKNSLGLVKFMFPNSNDIYFHDSPSKGAFKKDNRAISHGCVRVAKAREFAITILQDDESWTPEKIDEAMNAGKESICTLKNKIPVHIGYFTAWVDEQGEINFYKDIYDRDERLAVLLYFKK